MEVNFVKYGEKFLKYKEVTEAMDTIAQLLSSLVRVKNQNFKNF